MVWNEENPSMGNTTLGFTAENTIDNDSSNARNALDPTATEQALLRGLIGSPANQVIAVLEGVQELDFHTPHFWTVCNAINTVAHSLQSQHQPGAPASIELVKDYLLETGALNDEWTRAALLEVATGTPNPWPLPERSAKQLKMYRLRRAMDTAGGALTAASVGDVNAISTALRNLDYLHDLARRAGIGGDRHAA